MTLNVSNPLLQVTEAERQKPLPELFADLGWKDVVWDEIKLRPVVHYLRNSKHVHVPKEFKKLIPKHSLDPAAPVEINPVAPDDL